MITWVHLNKTQVFPGLFEDNVQNIYSNSPWNTWVLLEIVQVTMPNMSMLKYIFEQPVEYLGAARVYPSNYAENVHNVSGVFQETEKSVGRYEPITIYTKLKKKQWKLKVVSTAIFSVGICSDNDSEYIGISISIQEGNS